MGTENRTQRTIISEAQRAEWVYGGGDAVHGLMVGV